MMNYFIQIEDNIYEIDNFIDALDYNFDLYGSIVINNHTKVIDILKNSTKSKNNKLIVYAMNYK